AGASTSRCESDWVLIGAGDQGEAGQCAGFLAQGRIEAQTKLRSTGGATAKAKERVGEVARGYAARFPSCGEAHLWSADCRGLVRAGLADDILQCTASADAHPGSFCRDDLQALPGRRTGWICGGSQPSIGGKGSGL